MAQPGSIRHRSDRWDSEDLDDPLHDGAPASTWALSDSVPPGNHNRLCPFNFFPDRLLGKDGDEAFIRLLDVIYLKAAAVYSVARLFAACPHFGGATV